ISEVGEPPPDELLHAPIEATRIATAAIVTRRWGLWMMESRVRERAWAKVVPLDSLPPRSRSRGGLVWKDRRWALAGASYKVHRTAGKADRREASRDEGDRGRAAGRRRRHAPGGSPGSDPRAAGPAHPGARDGGESRRSAAAPWLLSAAGGRVA